MEKNPQSYALGETESSYDSILKVRLETLQLSHNFMHFHQPVLFLNYSFSFKALISFINTKDSELRTFLIEPQLTLLQTSLFKGA